jgi:DNA-binding MarR family transcriptional regulator
MSSPSRSSRSISPGNRKESKAPVPDLHLLRQMPECVCLGLRRAARQITRHYDHGLAKVGLAAQQVTILAVVEIRRSISISDLAAFLGMDRTTLTRNLRLLFVRRLLERSPDVDRRKKMIVLTALGRERLAQSLPLWHAAQAEALKMIGAKEWREMLSRLDRALAALDHIATRADPEDAG